MNIKSFMVIFLMTFTFWGPIGFFEAGAVGRRSSEEAILKEAIANIPYGLSDDGLDSAKVLRAFIRGRENVHPDDVRWAYKTLFRWHGYNEEDFHNFYASHETAGQHQFRTDWLTRMGYNGNPKIEQRESNSDERDSAVAWERNCARDLIQ